MGIRAQASRRLALGRGRLPRGGCRDERGNILLMFALFMTLFTLLCAVVVDVGYWWVMGKKTQVAADACALAAAGELPQTWDAPPLDHCEIAGRDYAKTNLPHEGVSNEPRHMATVVTTPYPQPGGGDPATYVEAEVTVEVRTFFGRVVGLDNIELSRRAVAERSEGQGDYAIYSHSSDCTEGLEFNGNVHAINGRVHSNGEYLVNNGGSQPFWAKSGTTAQTSCTHLTPAGQVRFGGSDWATGTNAPTTVVPQSWPEWFIPSDFGWQTCSGADFSGQKIEIDDTTIKVTGRPDRQLAVVNGRRVIPSGTYCATELFKIGGNNLDGNITALAPKIEVAGNGHKLTPFATNKVLFFNVPNTDGNSGNDGAPNGTGPLTCSSTEEMKLYNGNDGSWEGKVFHPCGRVLIDGDGTRSLKGAIYALRVRVNGNGFTMIGTGGGNTTKIVALVE